METSTLTVKGQTTIPKAIRERMGLKPGDRVRFFLHSDGALVVRPELPVTALRGMVKWSGPAATIEEMNDAIAEGAVEGVGLDQA